MLEGSGLRQRIAVSRFHQILDDKSAPAKPSDQLLPAMQKLNRARLAMLAPSITGRNGPVR